MTKCQYPELGMREKKSFENFREKVTVKMKGIRCVGKLDENS